MQHLFVYGSLMNGDIWHGITGIALHGKEAVLHGFRKIQDEGRGYPVIIHSPDDKVYGLLVSFEDKGLWSELDRYEGPEYKRIIQEIRILPNKYMEAYVYVSNSVASLSG